MIKIFYRVSKNNYTAIAIFVMAMIISSCSKDRISSQESVKRIQYDEDNVFDPSANLLPEKISEQSDLIANANQLSDNTSKSDYLLRVAYYYLEQNNHLKAIEALNTIQESNLLPYFLQQRYAILQGYSLASENKLRQSAELLNQNFSFSREFQEYNYLTQSWLLEARAILAVKLDSAESAIKYYSELNNVLPRARLYENQMELFNYLTSLDENTLIQLKQNSNRNVSNWAELASNYFAFVFDSQQSWQQSVERWNAMYGEYLIADPQFISEIKLASGKILDINPPINIVSLMLPLSNKYSEVSKAIEQGYRDAAFYFNPTMTIQTVDYSQNFSLLEHSYRNQRTQLILGPLGKTDVNNFTREKKNFEIPTILLGESYVANTKNAINFTLSPEDEVTAVVDFIEKKQLTKTFVIYPNDSKGQRLYNYFQALTAQRNISINGEFAYQDDKPDTDALMEQLERYYEINKAQASVFIIADASIATFINPKVQERFADLAILSTSSVNHGNVNKPNQALNNIIFPDMPWLMANNPQAPRQLQQNFEAPYTALDRFYAYGVDLYLLTKSLSEGQDIKNTLIKGVTADIRLSKSGQIIRDFKWYQYSNGFPVAYNSFY